MARYREFRKIDSDMVRSMCIRESYYTRGDVDAYTHLLVDLCDFKKEITMDDLEEITEDILSTQMSIAFADSMAAQKRSYSRVHCGS